MALNWSFFDSILCINLVTRPDRYEQASRVFNHLNIPVKFYRPKRHPTDGRIGCYESHIECIHQAYYSGAQNCLIFEDDIEASNYITPELLNHAIDFMKNNQNWDLFYLGTHYEIKRNSFQKVTPWIVKGGNICTHAYVINRPFMKKLINMPWIGQSIDYIYMYNEEAYGIYPSFFYQSSSDSDISDSAWNRLEAKRYWFQGVEMYAYYINIPLTILAIIIIVILLLLYIINPVRRFTILAAVILLLILVLILYNAIKNYSYQSCST